MFLLPLGLLTGLLEWAPAQLSWLRALRVAVTVLMAPAILEEFVWRGLCLPHPLENPSLSSRWGWGIISLSLYLVSHPLNSMTFYPGSLEMFTLPIFLASVVALGLICMAAYWRSGSIWLPVAIHWLVVMAWLLLFNGYNRLHDPSAIAIVKICLAAV